MVDLGMSRGLWLTFFLFGLVNNLTFVIFLSAAEELAPDHAGLVLLSSIVPGLLTKLSLGFWAPSVPYRYRITFVSLTLALCCLGASLTSAIPLILAAVGFAAVGGGVGEGSFVSLAGESEGDTGVGGWSSGTGFAGVAGAGIFLGFRALGFGVESVLRIVCILPIVMGAVYWTCIEWQLPRDEEKDAIDDTEQVEMLSREIDETKDPKLSAQCEHSNPDGGHRGSIGGELCLRGGETERKRDILAPLLLRFVSPLIVVYFAEYTINQGVLPTLDRFNGGKKNVELYARFQFAYQVGVFVSRSSIEFVKVRRLWFLSLLQVINLVFLVTAALLMFITNPVWVYLIVFYEGLLGGAAYVNTFSQLRQAAPKHLREWAMTVTTVGDSVGVSLAAVVDTFVECGVRRLRGEGSCASFSRSL